MKLTKEKLIDFSNMMQHIHDKDTTRSMAMSRIDECERTIQQILDNQKIVGELLHFHRCPIVPSNPESEGIKHYLNAIVKIATGKDISATFPENGEEPQ